MDLLLLPADIINEIFIPAEPLDEAARETSDCHKRHIRLVTKLRLICKRYRLFMRVGWLCLLLIEFRWKAMAERLPVAYTINKNDTINDIQKFCKIFPNCRALRFATLVID